MGIYSRQTVKESSEFDKFLEESFSCFNESYIELQEKVEFMIKGSTSWSELNEMVQNITESNIPDHMKLHLIDTALECMRNQSITNEEAVNEAIILEFKGNDTKNQEFIEILQELDELCTFFMERIKKLSNCMGKFYTITKNIIDKPNSFKTKLEDARGLIKEFNDWYDKACKKINGQVTWHKFKSKVRTFNNKYSEVTMEEKKKIDAKFTKFQKEMDEYCLPWYNGDDIKDLIKNLDKLNEIDEDYAKSLRGIIAGCQQYLIDEVNYTWADICFARKKLGIEKENGVLYKVINKILK